MNLLLNLLKLRQNPANVCGKNNNGDTAGMKRQWLFLKRNQKRIYFLQDNKKLNLLTLRQNPANVCGKNNNGMKKKLLE